MRPNRVVLGEGIVDYFHSHGHPSALTLDGKDLYVIGFKGKRVRIIYEILPELEEKKK